MTEIEIQVDRGDVIKSNPKKLTRKRKKVWTMSKHANYYQLVVSNKRNMRKLGCMNKQELMEWKRSNKVNIELFEAAKNHATQNVEYFFFQNKFSTKISIVGGWVCAYDW